MGIIVEWVELMNQRGEVVQSGEHVTMIRKRVG
jgi:acyl dehydratase